MNFMFIRARYNYIQLIILQRIEGKARFLYSLPFPPSSNGMRWYAVILILIAIPADANFLNGYALNGSVLVGYVLKIRIGGICIGGIRLRFLLMHTFWMDTFAMDTYWWDTFGRDTFGMDMCGICMMCWICMGYVWWLVGYVLQPFEWIRIAWICVGYVWCAGYVWDMCGDWWDTYYNLLNGYALHGYVLVGYVWVGYVWNGYVWDMCDVLDMCGICVVDTFGMDMCGICVMCWICVGYVWCEIRQQSSEEPCDETSFGKKNRVEVVTGFFSFLPLVVVVG